MKINDVPQDRGMIGEETLQEVCYALDQKGRYVLTPSAGWEPKNIVNEQAWDLINQQICETMAKIDAGKLSPLAYHMVKNQMNIGLLAKYVGYNRWRVWRHLKPSGFRKLTPDMLKQYAEVFDLDVDELTRVPKEKAA
jgi:hypothetical protein